MIELMVAIALSSFMIIATNELLSNINNAYKLADSNSSAVFLIESIVNKVKASIRDGNTYETVVIDDISVFTDSPNWSIKILDRQVSGIKIGLFKQNTASNKYYEFRVPNNE